MPVSPGAVLPRDMDQRQWATFLREGGIQGARSEKSFTPSWTGFSSAPTGDLKYMDFGAIVAIWCPIITTGTSNDTTFLITNLPAPITPSTNFRNATIMAIDNNVNVSAAVSISTTGVLTFQIGVVSGSIVTFSSSGWTAASNKGLPAGATIVYTK